MSWLGSGLESACAAHSRDGALAELERLLAEHDLSVSAAEICGDRWGGKTRLLQEFASVAKAAGWRVAAGSAASALPGMPLGVFADALNELADHYQAHLSNSLSPAYSRWLGGIFPALEGAIPAPRLADPTDMYNVFQSIRRMVEEISTQGDLLLLLDDMHWADEASVNLLGYLLRHPPRRGGKVVVVVAHRPRQGDGTVRSLMSAAVANGVARRIILAPLGEADALAGLPDRLPPDVLATCLRDFRALSDLSLSVARLAAVLDEPFGFDMLKNIAPIDDAKVWAAIDELIREDLICYGESPLQLRFANSLLRAAAYQSSGTRCLAGRVAAVLAAATCQQDIESARLHAKTAAEGFDQATDDEVARHLEELYWLIQAEIALGDNDAALGHGERGLRLAEQGRPGSMVPLLAAAETGSLSAESGELDLQRAEAQSKLDKLSKRELEIACMVSTGDTNQRIARRLGLSDKTVETYLARIFKKMVVSCRAEVAANVGRSGRPFIYSAKADVKLHALDAVASAGSG